MAGNLVLIRTRRQYTLASTFLRFQEHYESPKFRGEIFSLEEFMDWYTVRFGNFTYYEDWGGFNFPSSVLKPFRKGKFSPLSKKEQRLLGLLADVPEPFYVVGTYGMRIDLSTLKHELVHGLYYTVPEYQEEVLKALSAKNTKTLTDTLKRIGYHPSVWQDEINAYLLMGASALHDNGFRWTHTLRECRKELQAVFRQHFGFSLRTAKQDKILSYFLIKEM